jgi:multiple sugar transport system permease protein
MARLSGTIDDPRAGYHRVTAQALVTAALKHFMLILVALSCIVPFVWMVGTSLKAPAQVFTFPPELIPDPVALAAWRRVFTEIPVVRYAMNSVFVATTVMAGQLVFNVLAAYAFARIPFRGREVLFVLFLGTMMIPSQVTIIPGYVLMQYFGWVDTYFALTMPFLFGSAFGVFLLRQFFLTLPRDLEDAARVDGAGHLRILWYVVVPLAKAVMAAFSVFSFMHFWNDFMWPLIVINSESKKTLTVGIASLSRGYFGTDWPLLMAGTTLSVLPVLVIFFLAQKYFVQGIALTGLKG